MRAAVLTSVVLCMTCELQNADAADTPAGAVGRVMGPDIGFDYRGFIAEHMKLLSNGEIDKAVDHLYMRRRKKDAPDGLREELRKKFSLIYGMAKNYEGYELVGYKQLSTRNYTFYVLASFENIDLIFIYRFGRDAKDWNLTTYSMSDKLDELESLLPLHPIGEGLKGLEQKATESTEKSSAPKK